MALPAWQLGQVGGISHLPSPEAALLAPVIAATIEVTAGNAAPGAAKVFVHGGVREHTAIHIREAMFAEPIKACLRANVVLFASRTIGAQIFVGPWKMREIIICRQSLLGQTGRSKSTQKQSRKDAD